MIAEYGSHRHPDAEVFLKSVQRTGVRSGRGDIWAHDISFNIGGTLRNASGTESLLTQKEELDRVYSVQHQRFTLYSNDNSVLHRLDPATTVDGVYVTAGPTYPDIQDAAWVTTLDFEITLSARVEVDNPTELIQFEERVDISGGLPRVVFLPRANGPPTRQVTQQRTPYVATQSGVAVGRRFRPNPPPRKFGGDMIARRVGKASPKRLAAGVYREYSVQWSYTFISGDQLNAEPHIR